MARVIHSEHFNNDPMEEILYLDSGQVGTGGVPNGNVPPGQQGVNPNAPNAGGDTRPGQPFPVIPPPNQQPPPQNPNQQFPPPGPQPFPGGQGTPNPNGPPPQGIPNGQEFPQPNSNNTPQQPRFPPPQGQPNTPTDFGSNPNNVAPGGGQRPPQSGVNPGSEPELRNFSTTTFSPNAINGGQQADVIPRGDRYNCICNGPPYCSGGRCKGDLCSTIEFATSGMCCSSESVSRFINPNFVSDNIVFIFRYCSKSRQWWATAAGCRPASHTHGMLC